MRKFVTLIILSGFIFLSTAYDKTSLVERFTNCSCGPCATLNNSWYNVTTAGLVNSGSISHLVYNVYWPSDCDPMHLLNQADNNYRTNYYGCNAVPWIEINGVNVATDETAFMNAVNSGNAEYSPFSIVLTPERLPSDVIDVKVKIIRDISDVTTFDDPRLRLSLTEKVVEIISNPCCNNGETHFYSINRKMLPNAQGTSFEIPAPGDSIELSFSFVPSADFLQQVNLDSLRVVAFIQDHCSQEMYQSVMTDITSVDRVNAAFTADETMGASPLMVTFTDYSSATTSTTINTWEWDFDNDGTIDSYDQNPTWNFTDEQSYTVSLTVSNGVDQHTRVIDDYINVLGKTSDILVVNGIVYATYTTQMEDFYYSSACFGNNQVDVWDLMGDLCFDYSLNPNIQQVNLFNRNIPTSILKLYHKVIWIGNSYGGDDAFYDPQQVLAYVQEGGNFLLATREGAEFFDSDLQTYCGITSFSGLLALTELIALDDSLVNIPVAGGTNDRNQFALLDVSSEAIPIFDDNVSTNWIAGFRIQKDNEGSFIYIAGRPYRFNNTAMSQNYEYMIDNWLNYSSVAVLTPNGGEVWVVGETEDITWTGVNVNDVKIELSVDNGSNWTTIVESTPNTGTYPWMVTAQDSSDECLIRITNSANGFIFDESDAVFTIDVPSTVEEILNGIPTEYELSQNYPNPFNPTTSIEYSVPEESRVSIKIYDLTGSEVARVVDGYKKAGRYRLTLNAENLASGIYFYHMRAGEYNSVKKMSILK